MIKIHCQNGLYYHRLGGFNSSGKKILYGPVKLIIHSTQKLVSNNIHTYIDSWPVDISDLGLPYDVQYDVNTDT